MSEELRDEVEAINSIYGEGCLTPADDGSPGHDTTYVLKLPGDEASSLRLRFPASYPAEPPAVLGTHHSSGGRKGAGARDLGLFRDAVAGVFQEGAVCLFDAMEEFTRRHEEEEEEEKKQKKQHEEDADDEGVRAGGGGSGGGSGGGERTVQEEQVDFASMAPPPWTLSEPITENKSTFVARVARVTSAAQASLFVQHLLWSDKRVRSATHNITAWRVRGGGGGGSGAGTGTGAGASYQDCDDDGETAAGARLLHLMQVTEVWDAVVVVTRWYGGVKLGPRRFALINSAARDGLVRAGLVVDNAAKDNRGEKKARA